MTEDPARDTADMFHIPRTRSPEDNDLSNPTADERDRSAADRNRRAEGRDQAAQIRDERADARDVYAEARDRFDAKLGSGAAADRAGSRQDRQGAARDRRGAARDRDASSTERILSARERVASSIDELTGAYSRDAGLLELDRETARANRTGESFVLAFIDVDGLKATNDSKGHAAGDRLLRQVVETLRLHFRSYDLIVRVGGDEFLCALLGLDNKKAAERFVVINAALAADVNASVSVGLTEYQSHDSLDNLISRADTALLVERRQRLGRS